MQKLFNTFLFILLINQGLSQSNATLFEGNILFEKKINLYAGKNVSADYKRLTGQFRTTYFNLIFNKTNTAYIPSASNRLLDRVGIQPAENNSIYIDAKNKVYQSTKQIFDELFVVEDTLPKISWKITSEKRTIAGFECRRANAIIFDSVYVVAFYADDIPYSLGPELFNGLPGMILGLSLPHLHINIFATKLLNQQAVEREVIRPVPTKIPITSSQLKRKLLESSKSWGTDAFSFLIQALL